jgi:GNAT superfamily N-acetyltransferase
VVAQVLAEAEAWLAASGRSLWRAHELAEETLAPEVGAGHYFIGARGAETAGVLRFTLEDTLFWPDALPGEAGYVHRLAVRRSAAGGETSRALLEWAQGEARRRGCAFLRLDCAFSRPRLRALYERLGFRFHSDRQVEHRHSARYELKL